MRVAVFVLRFPVPSETFVLRHVLALLAAGVDVTIVCGEGSNDWKGVPEHLRAELQRRLVVLDEPTRSDWVTGRGLASIATRAPFDSRARMKLAAAREAVRHRSRQAIRDLVACSRNGGLGRFDVIIAHFGPAGVRAAFLRNAGLLAGPIATVFHGYDMSARGTVERYLSRYRRLFKETELLLPISRFWAAQLELWGAPRQKIRVLHMGVDVPSEVAAFEKALHSPLRVLAVGRFTEKKGLRYAIDAVRKCRVPAVLEIIGYGELEAELRETAATPGTNNVRFLGQQSHAAVLERMATSDVFILPSVTASSGDMEGIPVSLMEAMIRGCLVISTRHSGISELVDHERSGLLVAERSPDDIASALTRIASGAIDVASFRRSARAAVVADFDNHKLDVELLDILSSLSRDGAISGQLRGAG